MARIAQTARMQIRINDKTLDTRGITPRSPLEEQAMLIWYTAHARVQAADDAKQDGLGVQGSFNMHWHIKDLFSCTDDDARYVSSRVRQVFKKTGAARCISVGGAGHSPIWWISDTLPDNIVTIAEWVTAHHGTVDPTREGYKVKPTRAEKRLSEHEAGEDRPAEPVTVIKTGDDTVTATFTELADPPAQDMEVHEVEVEGPSTLHPHIQAQKEEAERWMAMVVEIITKHGPMTGIEVNKILIQPPYRVGRTDNVVVRTCKDLVEAGRLVTRFETVAEQQARQRGWDKRGGRTARLFAINSEQLATSRDVPVAEVGPGSEREVALPIAPPGTPAGRSLREQLLDLGAAVIALAAELADSTELDDLRVMNGLLEEENSRLSGEVSRLRTEIKLERERAAKVRALYS